MACASDQPTTIQVEASSENTCPECGQSLYPTTANLNRRPRPSSWLPWVLIGIGLYLVLVFRGQMLHDAEFLPSSEVQTACAQPPGASSANPKLCLQAIRDKQSFEHDEAAVDVGGVVLLLGVVRLVRQSLVAFQFSRLGDHVSPTNHRRRRHPLAVALIVWTHVERLLLLGLQFLLLIAVATLIVWVANGTPLSVDLVNAAIRRAVDAVFVLRLMVS